MPPDIRQRTPPDDSGSDTFARYRYQALVTFSLCLDCALGGAITCVILEHIEDVAVQVGGQWRLIQIKTRDLERGPWKLTDLLADGGGLHGLVRSYRATSDLDCTYELLLEGPLKRNDLIQNLLTEAGRHDAGLIEQVRVKLKLSAEECSAFLTRVRLVPDQPNRKDIVSRNFRHLSSQAPYLSGSQLDGIHSAILAKIEDAMAGDSLADAWPRQIIAPDAALDALNAKIAAKRLTRDVLAPLVAPINSAPMPLLRRLVDDGLAGTTVLEEKLLTGGATQGIVESAKSLRANAAIREAELASSGLWPQDDVLEDIRQRLELRVKALRADHEGDARPAIRMWRDLIHLLGTQAAAIDRRGIFFQDPDLLLGEICQMADLCMTDWGLAGA